MDRKKSISRVALAIIFYVLAVSIIGSAVSVLQVLRTISSSGTVKGVGVGIYWNSNCTNPTSSISWGTLDPSSRETVTVYIRNEGNTAVKLTKTTQNWVPSSAANYLTLTWNYANQTIAVNMVLKANLTLAVASNVLAVNSFSFDMVITAIG